MDPSDFKIKIFCISQSFLYASKRKMEITFPPLLPISEQKLDGYLEFFAVFRIFLFVYTAISDRIPHDVWWNPIFKTLI
jgi:hypothetical protein